VVQKKNIVHHHFATVSNVVTQFYQNVQKLTGNTKTAACEYCSLIYLNI